MSRGTVARLSRQALISNISVVRQYAPDAKVWAVIKANAYGHGAVWVSQTLARLVEGFAVATLEEAIELRNTGISNEILLLEGIVDAAQLQAVCRHKLTLVVHCEEQLEFLRQASSTVSVPVWIKLDTGMHRLGFEPRLLEQVKSRISSVSNVHLAGVMSHFASAGQDTSATEDAFQQFLSVVSPNDTTSLANSATVLTTPKAATGWVRPGIMLYGASPLDHVSVDQFGLTPVMSLFTSVIAVRDIRAGERVGYGLRWQAQRPSRIATLAIGYADGYPRHAPGGTPFWINGRRAPLVGAVSMDMITIDVTDVGAVAVGDQVECWGINLSVDEVAAHIGTIGYELLTRVSARVHRKVE